MELTVDHEYIFNMYQLISVPNQHLIRQLLIYDCVSIPQMHFNLMKIFSVLYHIPIEYSTLGYVLNSFVTSYLKSVVDKSLSSSVLDHYLLGYPINIEHDFSRIIINRLRGCFLHNSQVMRFTHTASIKPITCDIPVEVHVHKSENLKAIECNKSYSKTENFLSASDFQSFLLPLEQDYTKSSKGYISHVISITDSLKNGNSRNILNESDYLQMCNGNNSDKYILEEYDEVQQKELSKHSNTSESKSNNEVSDDSEIVCCQKGYSQNKHREIHFNYALKVFSDCVKEQLDYNTENDSDSDDSVVFFGSSTDELNSTFVLGDVSDSDDSMFSENFENAQINDVNIKKFWNDNYSDSSSDDNWNSDFDESASDLFESFSLNFKNDFPTLSTCLQSEMHVRNEPLSSCGYVNACFEDDDVFNSDRIISVNNNWNNTMKGISSEPRQAKRVSFVPLPDLVAVCKFEPDNDGYCYSTYVLNQIRFQNRIQDFEAIMAPYLTSEHRAKIYRQNYLCER